MGLFDPSTWSLEGVAKATVDLLDPVYGEGAPLEFVAEAVTPEAILAPYTETYTETILPAAKKVLDTGDDWLSAAIANVGDVGLTYPTTFKTSGGIDIGSIVSDLFNVFSNPETSPLTPYAEAYVDWYEGDTTTAEFISDPIGTTTAGVVDVITDIVGTDIVVGSIEAAATPLAAILDPITEPIGEGIEKLIVPAAILGGAYLLLK